MARRPVGKPLSLAELTERFQDGLKQQIARPNLYAYKPHKKQYQFHTNDKHTRLYIGGNRSGKTVGGAVETCYWLMKKHPYRRLPLPEEPIRGRAVAVDFNYGVDILMIPEISRWLPPSFLINGSWEDSYNKDHRLLTLANKSTLEFRSYEQDLDKHAGASRHFIWFDEEPPNHIYNENQMRILDTHGYIWVTMTPVEGLTWTYEGLYLKGIENPEGDIGIIEIDTNENPHLSQAAIEMVMGALDPEERKARERGEYISVGGKIFKMFSTEDHVIEPINIKEYSNWELYASLDHGFNNPTAILFHVVSPDNKVITFAEHYEREMIIEDHAKAYHEIVKNIGRTPTFNVGDPAINQRSGVTGTSVKQEYADRGIYWADGNNDVLSGVVRMAAYLKTKGDDNQPLWTITANCTYLIKEMKKLRWASFQNKKAVYENNRKEQIHKKDDHAPDSARYFFSFMPDLTPVPSVGLDMHAIMNQHASVVGATHAVEPTAGRWDELVSKRPIEDTQWEYSYGNDYV